MHQETQNSLLNQLIDQLKTSKKSADDLFSEQQELWHFLGFNQAQVTLWLASLPARNILNESKSAYQTTSNITEHLTALLRKSGGRMLLTQVLKKLPAGTTTTEQQLRKLAEQNHQMNVKGPFLVLDT
ncbi:hypothetical protein [Psychrobacter immobilis]|uniref:hypothetical protein n=1 Tax=Psychrobacter immobilis TaxID=498 RepID=UPI0019194A83|nr:hypothetical protein [Psychrobacter immobilis]|tara:strand:- start:334 stop:717 length:384 start_codon:yes stop_codon:yes gene_type:complete